MSHRVNQQSFAFDPSTPLQYYLPETDIATKVPCLFQGGVSGCYWRIRARNLSCSTLEGPRGSWFFVEYFGRMESRVPASSGKTKTVPINTYNTRPLLSCFLNSMMLLKLLKHRSRSPNVVAHPNKNMQFWICWLILWYPLHPFTFQTLLWLTPLAATCVLYGIGCFEHLQQTYHKCYRNQEHLIQQLSVRKWWVMGILWLIYDLHILHHWTLTLEHGGT